MIENNIKKILYKGGLKFKLIILICISIFLAISIQNYFIIPFIKKNIEKKAFEVSFSTIERISDFSSFVLLERSYENRLALNDIIKRVEESKIEGLLGVAIYQRQKEKEKNHFQYIAGFGEKIKNIFPEKKLLQYLKNRKEKSITYDMYTIQNGQETIETYRFIRPIFYHYNGKNILLGFALLYYDKKAISNVINKVLNYIYITTLITLLLLILSVYFIALRITQPILAITKASSDITKGNFNIYLNIKTNDEIENLANHFNTMVAWLKERENLKKFVSDSTVDMIQKSLHKPIVLGGKYKNMTFLFCDIRNFTTLNETKDPQDVLDIINFYFTLQAEIIKKNKGDIDKFIGDEIMASFSGREETINAIKSALEIQKKINEINTLRKKENKIICKVGIGISRGKVVVGNIGHNEHMDYTAIGPAVNIASRLCSYAKENEIIIDEETFKSSKYKCHYKIIKPLKLKGISCKIIAYSIFLNQKV